MYTKLSKMVHINRLSKIFHPIVSNPKGTEYLPEALSRSLKLFIENGIVKSTSNGMNILLPMAMRSINKLKNLINYEMNQIMAQEICLPLLTPSKLLEQSQRLDNPEIFRVRSRNNREFVLSPTNEEAIASFVANEVQLSGNHFPLRLYQITSKFRDEMKPRFGLMRSKEFIMKDLYSFDTTPESSVQSYEQISKQYSSLFERLGVPFVCVEGSTGDIGGILSHEYHFLSPVGEDKIIICKKCNFMENQSIAIDISNCKKCGGHDIATKYGIEVGHTFLLGTKYTEPLKCRYTDEKGKKQVLHMSCYGIGLSRIIAAAVEVLATDNEIRWPHAIAPYSVCIIPPKKGSKEETIKSLLSPLYANLDKIFENDVIVDDRTDDTIGKRLKKAKQFGYPFIIVLGKSAVESPHKLEVHHLNSGTMELLGLPDIGKYIQEKIVNTNSKAKEALRTY